MSKRRLSKCLVYVCETPNIMQRNSFTAFFWVYRTGTARRNMSIWTQACIWSHTLAVTAARRTDRYKTSTFQKVFVTSKLKTICTYVLSDHTLGIL